MPTVAVIGGGRGGNLVAVRLLARAPEGLRLNVVLIEARGRASKELRSLLRDAETDARGAFLTRLRGEVVALAPAAERGVHVMMRSGRLLEVHQVVVALGSYAAAALPGNAISSVDGMALALPSDLSPDRTEELAERADEVAALLVAGLSDTAASLPSPTQT